MAAPEYLSGCDAKGWLKPAGWAAALEVDMNRWSARVTSNNKDVSGTKSGRRRIKGCDDASGSFDMHYDSANLPPDDTMSTGLNLRHGSVIAIDIAPTGAAAGDASNFRATVIVDEANMTGEFDGIQEWNVTWSLQDGTTLLLPGDPVPGP
jgi:hypothetical protein